MPESPDNLDKIEIDPNSDFWKMHQAQIEQEKIDEGGVQPENGPVATFSHVEAAHVSVDAGEDNIVGLIELGVGLEAIGDNIIVLIDNYRSGYECTACKGTGKLRRVVRCTCDPNIADDALDFPRGTRNRFGA